MSATRDSDTDLAKVFPDLKTMEREADPSRRRARLEQALNTPPVVDAALTILREGLKEGEDPLYYQVPPREREQESPAGGAHGNDGDAAPSPWSTPAGDAVPKEMLPSASAPAAAPPTTGTPPVAEALRDRGARRPGRSMRSAVIAVLAVFGPLIFMWALLVRPQGSSDPSNHASSAAPSAAVAALTAPVGPATAAATTDAVAPATASATAAAPVPAASADAGAVAPPPASPTRHVRAGHKEGQGDDPYDTAPAAPPSTAPASAPAPQPPAPPPSSSSPKVSPIY
jgi:hypothetical protein